MHHPATMLPEWTALIGLGVALIGLPILFLTPYEKEPRFHICLIGLAMVGLGAFSRAFGLLTGLI